MNIIKETLGTTSKATMFRKLKPMGYRASYSHAGKFYTLDEIANYNKYGIWSFDQIHFSRHGTLVNTLENIINKSKDGYFASELQALVHVRVFNALTQLVSSVRIAREQIAGEHLYISIMTGTGQLKRRKQSIMESVSSKRKVSVPGFSNEAVSECLQTFLSVLDEKQTRLYLGLESMKLGHGGDHKIYRLTGVNIKTIARGRRELTSKNITPERIRKIGAGRPSIKKKRSCEVVRRIDGE
jgi:hypothetical protein